MCGCGRHRMRPRRCSCRYRMKHFSEIDRRAGPDGFEVLIQPLPRDFSHLSGRNLHSDLLTGLGASSKPNSEWGFVAMLRDEGRRAASGFLDTNADAVGKRSATDIAILCRSAEDSRVGTLPGQPIAHKFERIGRRRGGRELPVEVGGSSPPAGKVKCEPCVRPHADGSCHQDDERSSSFRADRRPKDLQMADRGEPHPVDQEVTHEPEQDQENSDDDGGNDEPDHRIVPWCLPFGSGSPDRHD